MRRRGTCGQAHTRARRGGRGTERGARREAPTPAPEAYASLSLEGGGLAGKPLSKSPKRCVWASPHKQAHDRVLNPRLAPPLWGAPLRWPPERSSVIREGTLAGPRSPPAAGSWRCGQPRPRSGEPSEEKGCPQQSDGLLDETIPVHSCTNTASFQTEGCATSSSQSRRSARPPPLPPDIAARDGSARSVGAHGTHHRSCLLRVPRRRPSQLHAQQPAARLRCKGEGTQTETERQSTRRGSG